MSPGESRASVCGWVPSAGQVSLSVSVGWGDTTFHATRSTAVDGYRRFGLPPAAPEASSSHVIVAVDAPGERAPVRPSLRHSPCRAPRSGDMTAGGLSGRRSPRPLRAEKWATDWASEADGASAADRAAAANGEAAAAWATPAVATPVAGSAAARVRSTTPSILTGTPKPATSAAAPVAPDATNIMAGATAVSAVGVPPARVSVGRGPETAAPASVALRDSRSAEAGSRGGLVPGETAAETTGAAVGTSGRFSVLERRSGAPTGSTSTARKAADRFSGGMKKLHVVPLPVCSICLSTHRGIY